MAKTPTPKDRPVNRVTLSNQSKQARTRRLVMTGTIVVAILVLAIILFGLLDTLVLQGNRTVATVNGEKIPLDEFQGRVRYTRNSLVMSYMQNLPMYQAFASDPQLAAQFGAQLQQILAQLDPTGAEQLGQSVLDQMITEKLIMQQAATRGINVSQDEINKALQEAFAYYPEGTLVPTSTPTVAPTSTLSALQLTLLPPTATPLPTSTPMPTEGTTVTPTATEAPASSLPTSEATETPIPTPTEYTVDVYNANYQEYLNGLKEIDFSEADLRQIITISLTNRKLFDAWLLENPVAPTEERVWARHILVADEATAKEVADKLDKGEDFAKLAAEYSTDTGNKDRGGDLGWFGKGQMVAPFEAAAWPLEVGQISEPVQTDFGYHIIQVLGHEDRPLTNSERRTAEQNAYNDWLKGLRTDETVKTFDLWKTNVPLTPSVPRDQIPAQLPM